MVLFPNAKINLGLFVKEKRSDNYHNIETVFYPIGLCDALEIVPASKETSLRVSGINVLSETKDNLCMKAYNLLKKNFDSVGPVSMHLFKKIPVGSGLGSGSSDAVHTLKILNTLFQLNLPDKTLYNMARELGSDCAFFVENKPLFAFEKGDVFGPVDLSLKGLYMVVVIPPVIVNTAMAYSKVVTYKNRESLKNIIALPIDSWQDELYNDFEFPIFEMYPGINKIKEKLYKAGAIYASMSGSGSAVYGIFENKIETNKKFNESIVWQGPCLL